MERPTFVLRVTDMSSFDLWIHCDLQFCSAFRGQTPAPNTGSRVGLGHPVAASLALALNFLSRRRSQRKGAIRSESQKRATLRIWIAPRSQRAGSGVGIMGSSLALSGWLATISKKISFYFTIGAAIAVMFNTAVDQYLILLLDSHTTLWVIAMMVLLGILMLCSTSDAFIAVSSVTFPRVARLAFLYSG